MPRSARLRTVSISFCTLHNDCRHVRVVCVNRDTPADILVQEISANRAVTSGETSNRRIVLTIRCCELPLRSEKSVHSPAGNAFRGVPKRAARNAAEGVPSNLFW